jgi:hypothetical protein
MFFGYCADLFELIRSIRRTILRKGVPLEAKEKVNYD